MLQHKGISKSAVRRGLTLLTLLMLSAVRADGQSAYRLEAKDQPPGGTSHTSFADPPTVIPPRRFLHWDLRELPGCSVPYAINSSASFDLPSGEHAAVNLAAASWTNVAPALITLDPRPHTSEIFVGNDFKNVFLWDNGDLPCPAPDDQATMLFCPPGSGVIAVTCIYYNGVMKILESDIAFNDRDYTWTIGMQDLEPPGPEDIVDVESIAVHEIGHFLGIHHTATAGPPGGPVMTACAEDAALKRALTAEDIQALNFLYTPDLGDAPDPWLGTFNEYPSKVQSPTVSRMLNGVGLLTPAKGPFHMFGHLSRDAATATTYPDFFEGLGPNLPAVQRFSYGNFTTECEAHNEDEDKDPLDDGVTFPDPLVAGAVNRFTVDVYHSAQAGRYAFGAAAQRLYVNGYLDLNDNCKFDATERLIWWDGVPGMTFGASPTFVSAQNPAQAAGGKIELKFDVMLPAQLPSGFFSRFRLDYGEDEGRANNWEGDLGPAVGAAQFGEVEDYLHGDLGSPAFYCDAKTTSQGCVPFLSTAGAARPSVTDTNPFNVRGNDHATNNGGILIYGFGKSNLNFHGGKLCVKSPIRTAGKTAKSKVAVLCTMVTSTGRLTTNFNNRIQGGIDPLLTAGQKVFAQWQQRDTGNTIGGFADNLSNGVSFTIRP